MPTIHSYFYFSIATNGPREGRRQWEQAISVFVAEFATIAEGTSKGINPLGQGKDSAFLVRKGNRIFAYSNACPHVENAPLPWRKDEYLNKEKTHIVCSGHGAEFEIENGLCVLGPCIGKKLKTIKVDIAEDGKIFLDL
jgi:nitrite reductase/ring-hydroxylating ferredoxin subunit